MVCATRSTHACVKVKGPATAEQGNALQPLSSKGMSAAKMGCFFYYGRFKNFCDPYKALLTRFDRYDMVNALC